MPENEHELARDLLEHIQEMEQLQAKPGTPKRLSFSIAELAQSKAGYLAYKSSRRVERASYIIAAMTVVLIVLTIVLMLKSTP